MSRTITSPVKRFEGTVVIPDYLNFDQVFAFQDGLAAAGQLRNTEGVTGYQVNRAALPGVLACVEEWHLAGMPERVTLETFPATPPISAARLLGWLINEISSLYDEAETIPND